MDVGRWTLSVFFLLPTFRQTECVIPNALGRWRGTDKVLQMIPAILLIVSVLTTPYAWLTDEVVVLPAILQAVAFVYQTRANMNIRTRMALFAFAFFNGLLLLILRSKIPFATGIYFWSSLVWFSWYLYARQRAIRLSVPETGSAGF